MNRIKLPEDVVAILAFSSLDSVLNSAKTALEMLDPANTQPGFISAAKEGIKESLVGRTSLGFRRISHPFAPLQCQAI